ncbi:hypothetical protein GCM10027596_22560 [Nocardioides korecus]
MLDADAIRAASSSWNHLVGLTNPVGAGSWVASWMTHLGRGYRPRVVVAGDRAAPDALFPLARHRGRPWFTESLGVGELFEATDVLGQDSAAVQAVATTMTRLRHPLRLRRIPADSPLLPHLRTQVGHRGVVLSRVVSGVPTIGLGDGDPFDRLSNRRRRDLRTARRRLDRAGTVTFSMESPRDPAQVDLLLAEFVTVEARSWKRGAGTALAVDDPMRDFFRAFCRASAATGILRFAMLRVDGTAVAAQLATEVQGRFSLFKIGFDEAYARSSPGNLLMEFSLRSALDRGLTTFDFLGSEEPWTAVWTDEVRRCLEVQVYPLLSPWTPVAAGAVAWQLLTRRARTALQRAAARRREGST